MKYGKNVEKVFFGVILLNVNKKLPRIITALNIFILLFFLSNSLYSANVKIIADFNRGMRNYFGGYYNRVVHEPSYANAYQDYKIHYGKSGRSLKIVAHKADDGWCGVWLHLYDTQSELTKKKIKFFNPIKHNYKYLSFMVKGAEGGEVFEIGVSDKKRLKSEDPLHIGLISDFLPNGVTKKWQEVIIPISLMDIDIKTFGLLLFDFTEQGDYTLYIDNICFKKSKLDKCHPKRRTLKKYNKLKKINKAMWVWLADDILPDKKKQNDLIKFCHKKNINEIFFQLIYKIVNLKNNKIKCEILLENKMKEFLTLCNKNNIKVHMLDGYPDWAMRKEHKIPIAITKAVINYNKSVPKSARFYGIHWDIEPYLMVAFKSPYRKKIFNQYFELLRKLKKLHKNRGLKLGVDIPFFYDEPDWSTGKITYVKYKGQIKPLSYWIIDTVDNVGIMAYRDFAFGADGMIFHSQQEINYADSIGGKPIYIGVETFKYPLINVYFIAGVKKEKFYKLLSGKAKDIAYKSRINGFRLQTIDDGKYVHIGIEIPQNYKDKNKIKNTLLYIAERIGINEYKNKNPYVDTAFENAEFFISSDVEWENCDITEWKYPELKKIYRGFNAVLIMLPKITYAEESLDFMQNELLWVHREFGSKKSFYGFAIHYYDTYRKMK